ncbi:MAG: hypothetical protein EOM52_06490 [Clostridia bacterium]|nr:hypothetical protein [Clostridia bacterium]
MAQFYPEGMNSTNLNQTAVPAGLVTPPPESFDTAAMRGSMQEMLSENLGQYVSCEFLVGTQAMARKEGILYSVGRAYILLYEELSRTFVACDIFSIKFVTFYMPGQRPGGRVVGQTPSRVPMVNVPGLGLIPAGPHGIGAGAPVGGSTAAREPVPNWYTAR